MMLDHPIRAALFAAAPDAHRLAGLLATQLDRVRLPPGGDLGAGGEARPAAVLVPIVLHPGAPTVLLTRRTAHLSQHAGQISFPGGRCEPEESAEAAALRECAEETGLTATHVAVVGRLPPWVTVTRYRVTPVVGLVTPGFTLRPQVDEVDEIFELPLSVVLDPARYIERAVNLPGQRLTSHAIDWEGRLIWGATAGMLRMLWQTLDSPVA